MQTIGPNTNASADLLSPDCILLVGEDPGWCEPMLRECFGVPLATHAFRSYVFQRRAAVTTIFSGMGSGCVQALIWELADSPAIRRLVLVGTAGLMPGAKLAYGEPYLITHARAAASAIDCIGLTGVQVPRWAAACAIAAASIVSTDFYYGFGEAIARPDHPLHGTRLRELFAASREQLVDMEVAAFYAMCALRLQPQVQYVALKSPANPAGEGEVHLANTPSGLQACIATAAILLK